jgi:hypothetical protein
MKTFKIIFIFFILSLTARGQFATEVSGNYPFAKYPEINFKTNGKWTVYDKREKENKMDWTMTFPKFYNNKCSNPL